MHFDTTTAAAELPRALQAMLARNAGEPAPGIARRSFLKVSAAGGFALGAFPLATLAQTAGAAPAAGLKPTQQPSAFVRIARDGIVTVTINRLDFGQGVQTALPMILADELDADWAQVVGELAPAGEVYKDPMFGIQMVGGSGSIAHSFQQYRELGAKTRAMLVAAAAERWNATPEQCRTEASVVYGPGRSEERRVGKECRSRWSPRPAADRKSTRLNSSHEWISYAVFCLKKKKKW